MIWDWDLWPWLVADGSGALDLQKLVRATARASELIAAFGESLRSVGQSFDEAEKGLEKFGDLA